MSKLHWRLNAAICLLYEIAIQFQKDNFHTKLDIVLKFHWADININTISEGGKLTQKFKIKKNYMNSKMFLNFWPSEMVLIFKSAQF